MYLKKCQIENFRSIESLELTFENNFQILVGLNESGKSNILRAISFLHPEIEPTDDDIRDPGHDEEPIKSAYIRFVYGLEPYDTKRIIETSMSSLLSRDRNTPIIQIDDKSLNLSEFCQYKKEAIYRINLQEKTKSASHWRLAGSQFSILPNWKKVPENWEGLSQFENKEIKFINVANYPNMSSIGNLEDLSVSSLNSFVGTYIIDIVENNLSECIVWKYSDSNLLPGRIDIKTFKASPDTCEPLKNIFYLAGHSNISKALDEAESKTNGMRNLLRRLSESATKHLREVWPEYKKVSITLIQNGTVIEAGVEDEYNVYSMERRSDGFKRFITFLLLISASAKSEYLYDSVIIIDEPDIGLHPSGIQFLRDEIKKISKENIVIIATHSIFMIDKDRIDRHLIVTKSSEKTFLTSDYSSDMLDEEVIYRAMGFSFYEMLQDQNIIFEGWTDKHAFNIWLKSTKMNREAKKKWNSIGFIHAFGAKDVNRVASHLENFNRTYFVLTDSDAPAVEQKKRFSGKGQWVTYKDLGFSDKMTIEDFIDKDYIFKSITTILKREQLTTNVPFSRNDFKSTYNEFFQEIISRIGLDKTETKRIDRIIKNEIFANLKSAKLDLGNLVSVIDIEKLMQ